MFFCLRVDLDYVPWDSPDASEFGHGEPASIMRLLEFAREEGFAFHFFVSDRVLRAFPATGTAVLDAGQGLDWLCKHPEEPRRFEEAQRYFELLGHTVAGMAVRAAWNSEETPAPSRQLKFLSAQPGPVPPGVKLFPVTLRSDREAIRASVSARSWTDEVKVALRQAASRNQSQTLSVRPQVLAKYDHNLSHIAEIVDFANAIGMSVQTLRQAAGA